MEPYTDEQGVRPFLHQLRSALVRDTPAFGGPRPVTASPRAADLPIGSVIIHNGRTIRHRGPLALPPGWRGDNGTAWTRIEINWLLSDGATVLHVGDGTEEG